LSNAVRGLLLAASLLAYGCGLLAAGTTIQVVNNSNQTGSFDASGPAGARAGGTLGPCHESEFFLDRGSWSFTIAVGSNRLSDSVTSSTFGQGSRQYRILPDGTIEPIAASSAALVDTSPASSPSPCG
jgi:hypothetical protein